MTVIELDTGVKSPDRRPAATVDSELNPKAEHRQAFGSFGFGKETGLPAESGVRMGRILGRELSIFGIFAPST